MNENEIIYCTACGRPIENSEDSVVYHGRHYCHNCCVTCDDCGALFPRAYTHDVYNPSGAARRVCRDCRDSGIDNGTYFVCDYCGDTFMGERYELDNGNVYCYSCYDDEARTCYECGRVYCRDDMEYDDDEEEYFCPSCYESRRNSGTINSYSYKPTPIFHGISNPQVSRFGDPLLMGFELEVDKGYKRGPCSHDLCNAFPEDVMYLKEDGSVDFEIVTHPHTLKAYLEEFDFDSLCRIPIHHGYRSHEAGTCGFHIHVGRKQLGESNAKQEEVIEKLLVLMDRHWNGLVKFSRRNAGQLDHWANKPRLSFPIRKEKFGPSDVKAACSEEMGANGRYKALNLCNRNTIEFRLWRGSLKPVTLKATLQFTHNLVTYAMNHSLKDVCNSAWEDLINIDPSEDLLAYIAERELRTSTPSREIQFVECDSLAAGANEFAAGDYVRIKKPSILVSNRAVGALGTVIEYENDDRVLIRLDVDHCTPEQRLCGHDVNARFARKEYYWVYAEDIELLPVNEARIGQTVVVLNDPDRGVEPGVTGVIKVFRNPDWNMLPVGVVIRDYAFGGHGLADDNYDYRYQGCNGWWFRYKDLRVINPEALND